MSSYTLQEDRIDGFVSNVSENDLVMCSGDSACFSLIAKQAIEPEKYNFGLMPVTPQLRSSKVIHKTIDYPDNPFRVADAVGSYVANPDRNVYMADINPYYFDNLGMDAKAYITLPIDGGYILSCDNALINIQDISFDSKILEEKKNTTIRLHALIVSEYHSTSATILGRLNKKEFAMEHINQGLIINSNNDFLHKLGQELENYSGDERYLNYSECLNAEEIEQELNCMDNDVDCLYKLKFMLVGSDPSNVANRLDWAEYLYQQGYLSLSKREFKNVITLDPNNEKATQSLELLGNVEDLPDRL